ncbi:hypothetical protein A2U01_0096665, partial [Trifolium medium]|nr:hypothetical protein [Trifolium medium]
FRSRCRLSVPVVRGVAQPSASPLFESVTAEDVLGRFSLVQIWFTRHHHLRGGGCRFSLDTLLFRRPKLLIL